ncbi:MAG TPA: hypothetical protein VMN36_17620 [Verrucomicrobiales bacterium]|nr:hypothetical protein [Verrucomicrobiales bacterium]
MTATVGQRTLLFLTGLFLLVGAGCSAPKFEREWKQALARGAPAKGIEGPWEGLWKSDATGHTGGLRCLVSAPEDRPAPWAFHYWFSWGGLQGSRGTSYTVREDNGVFRFSGEADLGVLGGVYRHEGRATADSFEASYHAEKDRGTFRMMRPAPAAVAGGSSARSIRRYRRRQP